MIQLLDLAVRAHGGLDAWRSIKSIELKASLNGELLRIKGHPEGIIDVLIHIEAREPALTITPFGRPDFAGHFLPDRVWLEGNGSGKEQVLRNPRRSFEGHSGTRLDCHTVDEIARALLPWLRNVELSCDSLFVCIP